MGIAITVSLIVTVLVIVTIFGFKAMGKNVAAWKAFAAANGLACAHDGSLLYPRITGAWKGVPVDLRVEIEGTSRTQQAWTIVSAPLASALPKGTEIRQQDEGAVCTLFRDESSRKAVLDFLKDRPWNIIYDREARAVRRSYAKAEDLPALLDEVTAVARVQAP